MQTAVANRVRHSAYQAPTPPHARCLRTNRPLHTWSHVFTRARYRGTSRTGSRLGKRPTRPQNVSWGISGSEITRQASMRVRSSCGSPILIANATSAPGEPTMETKITEQYFQYETNKYFRGNAHSLQLGSFGEKKDPIGAKAYLDVQGAIKPIYLARCIKYNTTTKIDWSQTNKTEVEAEGAFKFSGLT